MDKQPPNAAQAERPDYILISRYRMKPTNQRLGRVVWFASTDTISHELSRTELQAMLAEDQAQRAVQGESNVAEIQLKSMELRRKLGGPIGRVMGALGIDMYRKVYKVHPEKA